MPPPCEVGLREEIFAEKFSQNLLSRLLAKSTKLNSEKSTFLSIINSLLKNPGKLKENAKIRRRFAIKFRDTRPF